MDKFPTIGSFTRRSRASRNYVEETVSSPMRSHLIHCFDQFLRLKPKHRPWSSTRRQPSQAHCRQLHREHPVPTCRPAHRWLVGPESRHPNRDARILQWSGHKLGKNLGRLLFIYADAGGRPISHPVIAMSTAAEDWCATARRSLGSSRPCDDPANAWCGAHLRMMRTANEFPDLQVRGCAACRETARVPKPTSAT
jgi:hypothetical protein